MDRWNRGRSVSHAIAHRAAGYGDEHQRQAGRGLQPRLGSISAGRSWHGRIAEVLLFDRALDEATRIGIEQYLVKKWGLADQHGPLTGDTAARQRPPADRSA